MNSTRMSSQQNETSTCSLCNNCTANWIHTNLDPRKKVDHVETFVMVAVVFMMVLIIGAPWRRRSGSAIVNYGVGGVFILSFPLVSYSLGLLQGPIIKTELNPVWIIFLVLLFGGTNAMSIRKLDENKQWYKIYLEGFIYLLYAGLSAGFDAEEHKYSFWVMVGFIALTIMLGFTYSMRVYAVMLASTSSSSNGIKMLSRYMKLEHTLSTTHDPRTMQGYNYKVLIHMENGVTLDQIWCGDVGVMSSSSTRPHVGHLRDLCLSFSLFHLVVRRYFGYSCSESRHDKTRDLVLEGLLGTKQGYARAFQVIEVELGFVYDFFFTKYAVIMYAKQVRLGALTLGITFLSVLVGILALNDVKERMVTFLPGGRGTIETRTLDIIATKVALFALVVLQLVQAWCYYVSDWVKVSLVCKYATNPSWRTEKLLLFLGTPHDSLFLRLFMGHHKWFRYWGNNIGQYSLLDSFRYWPHCLEMHSATFPYFRQGRKAGEPIQVPVQVKIAVAQTIKDSNCKLSNGTSALTKHDMNNQLGWATQIDDENFTLAHSILVWHIATSYCEMSNSYPVPGCQPVSQIVANNLSKYCAYLVAFVPTLLPGNPIETESTLDDLVLEARAALGNLVSTNDKYNKLRQLECSEGSQEETIIPTFSKGVLLGRQLERIENGGKRWDILADFWAEMMVYIAPSDNVADHIEHLAQGGEFVTHIWALLMHAGILDRPAPATDAAATAVAAADVVVVATAAVAADADVTAAANAAAEAAAAPAAAAIQLNE